MMTKIKEGYKETEIGVIPEDWKAVTLQEVGKVKSSKRVYQSDYVNNGIPFFRSKEIIELSKNLNPSVELYIESSQYNLYKEKFGVPQKDDLLVTSVGTIGKVWISDGREFYYKDGNLTQFTSNGSVDINLMKQLFESEILKTQYLGQSYGSAQVALTIEKLNKLYIPLPPLPEQLRIAEILSTTDNHIENLKKTIEDYQLLKKCMMKKLLTEGIGHTEFKETEIGRIPKEWEVKRIIDLADKSDRYSFTGGPFGSDLKSSDYTVEGIRVIQLQNIGEGYFFNDSKVYTSVEKANELNNSNIYPNELILAKMADPVARACKIPEFDDRYVMCSDGIRLKVNPLKYDSTYCMYSINSDYFRKKAVEQSTGTTRLRIGLTALKELKIAIPPLIEQQKISQMLLAIDDRIDLFDNERLDFVQLKKALMERLLTGKVRIV